MLGKIDYLAIYKCRDRAIELFSKEANQVSCENVDIISAFGLVSTELSYKYSHLKKLRSKLTEHIVAQYLV